MNAITFNAPRGRAYHSPTAYELAENLRQIEYDEERRLVRITNRLAYQDHLTRARNAKWYRRWWMSAVVWPTAISVGFILTGLSWTEITGALISAVY